MTLLDELRSVLNKHSRENESNTPDFLLATYMLQALGNAEELIRSRDKWYNIRPRPGTSFIQHLNLHSDPTHRD